MLVSILPVLSSAFSCCQHCSVPSLIVLSLPLRTLITAQFCPCASAPFVKYCFVHWRLHWNCLCPVLLWHCQECRSYSLDWLLFHSAVLLLFSTSNLFRPPYDCLGGRPKGPLQQWLGMLILLLLCMLLRYDCTNCVGVVWLAIFQLLGKVA